MASIPKSTFDSFIQDWNGRKSWAQSAGIPFNDFAATVKYDYNRMTNSQGFGSKMTDTEAFDAMAALKSGKNPFTTPADTTPSILHDPFGAVRNDVQGIVTGLFHLPQTVYHAFDDAAHGHFGTLANFIPFYTDIKDTFSTSGQNYLLEHPVSDMLDMFGAGKVLELGARGLDAAGADGAASELVSRLPSHPATKLMKYSFNSAADHLSAIDNLRKYGTETLGGLGQLKIQKEMILRPFRAAQDLIKHTAFPDEFTRVGGEFGNLPEGEQIFKYIDTIAHKMTRKQINMARNMAVYSTPDVREIVKDAFDPENPTPFTDPRVFLDDPTIPDATKNLYRAYVQASQNLRFANWVTEHAIKPIRNEKTGEIGWIQSEGSIWETFLRRYNKLAEKKLSDGRTLSQALTAVKTSLSHLKDDDANLPPQLKSTPDQTINIPNSLRRVADYYRVNGQDLFNVDRDAPRYGQIRAGYLRSIQRVFGQDSQLQHLINNLGSLRNAGEADELLADVRSVKRSMSRLNIRTDPVKLWLNSTLDDIKDTIEQLKKNQPNIGKFRDDYEKSEKTLARLDRIYQLNWNRYTQGEYRALVQKQMRSTIAHRLDQFGRGESIERKGVLIEPATIEKAVQQALAGNYAAPEIKAILGPTEYGKIMTDSWLLVSDMKVAGAQPIFVTGVNRAEEDAIRSGHYASITDISRFKHRSVEYEAKPVLTSTIFDPMFGIPKESIDIYRQKLVSHIINNFIKPLTLTNDELSQESLNDGEFYNPNDINDTALRYARKHGYTQFHPNEPFGKTGEGALTDPDAMWIKSHHLKLMRSAFTEMDKSLDGAWDKVMKAYRFGVLYASPRYAAHITLGGGLMTILRLEHPIMTPLRYMSASWQRAGDLHDFGVLISRGVSEQGSRGELVSPESEYHDYMMNPRQAAHDHPVEMYHFAIGKKFAEWYHAARVSRLGEGAGSTLSSYRELLEHISNFQRSLAAIEGEERAITDPSVLTPEIIAQAKRWNTTPEKYYGATLARKVLADMQVVSPMERAIIMRYIIPFWGWTRHIIRYIGTYPADHPLRASIIQSASNQAIGQDSVLPDYLFRLLFLGQPNAQGNVTVLDDRQWNPFRDVANYMTWGGIASTLNPVLQAITASAWGVNSATGSTGIYPQLTFDAFYGSMSAEPTGGNFFVDLAKQISPQIDTLLAATKSTSQLREQAKANPGTLGYLVGDSLGFPWIPETLNVKKIQIKGTTDEEEMASAAVQRALVSNSMAPLAGFSGLLPYSGFEVDKNFISELINQALAYNKATGLSIPASDLAALPYASPYVPEVIQGPQSEGQGGP